MTVYKLLGILSTYVDDKNSLESKIYAFGRIEISPAIILSTFSSV